MSRATPGTKLQAVVMAAVLAALAGPLSAAAAEPTPVPVPVAIKLMLKTLTFDRRFAERSPGDFVVLVVGEPAQAAARDQAVAAGEELKDFKLLGRAVRFEPVELRTPAGLKEAIQKSRPGALLVLPGLSDAGLEAVTQEAKEAQLYTMSLALPLVQRTILLGVFARDGRPHVALNRRAIHELHANFERTLLEVAELFPGAPAKPERFKPDF